LKETTTAREGRREGRRRELSDGDEREFVLRGRSVGRSVGRWEEERTSRLSMARRRMKRDVEDAPPPSSIERKAGA